MNHQSWLLEWTHEGRDLYPALRERIAADPELERRVRVEVFRRIGYYPTETSEHSSEYLPGSCARTSRSSGSACGRRST